MATTDSRPPPRPEPNPTGAAPRGRPGPPVVVPIFRPFRPSIRNSSSNTRPAPPSGVDVERPAGHLHALAHPRDPEVPLPDEVGPVRGEPDPVVLDRDLGGPGGAPEGHGHARGIRVTNYVSQRLLGHPVQDGLRLRRKPMDRLHVD